MVATKHWFVKFISKKLENSFDVMTFCYKKMKREVFYKVRNKCIEADKKKVKCLYGQLLKIEEKSLVGIRKDVNIKAMSKILPFFEKFNKIWELYKGNYLIRWKCYSAKMENVYYQNTIYEIYSKLSELMHKEHKFREECRSNQKVLKIKLQESNKLLDKVLI